MDEVILKLLKKNGRVIIPDFGALIVKQKSPFTVIFNEFLQYNDGALIGAIQSDLNVDRDVAAEKVQGLGKELIEKLGRGEEVLLNGIGVLTKSSTGKISLNDSSEAPHTIVEAEKLLEEVDGSVELDIEEDKKEVELENKIEEEKVVEKKPVPAPAPPEKKEEKPKVESPPTKPSTPIRTEKKEEPKSNDSDAPPPITEYYGEKAGKRKLNIILWIVIILLVNGSIISFFFFGDEIRGMFNGKSDIEVEMTPSEVVEPEVSGSVSEAEIEDSIIATPPTELVIEETADEPEETTEEPEVFAGTKYYVVAGVFDNEQNADNLVEKLKTNGYNAEKFTKIGKMYAVSYDVFPTKKEADRLLLKIQKGKNPGAWIKAID